jgi:N-methylhydantoinase A
MGGTSFDVSVICVARPTCARSRCSSASEIALPMVYVDLIGAGGGSIAHLDESGGLHVGPEIGRAYPGPACYGRGGTPSRR